MPSIPLDILDCSIYLYASPDAAEAGERAGGSGFLAVVVLPGYEAGTYYAVTNTHVIGAGYTTVRLNTTDGGHSTITIDDHDWMRHPDGDDVSIAEITLSANFRYKAISTESFVDGHDPTFFNVGQEVFMVGRYVNREGRQRNIPTARFGHIAQLPYEPIRTSAGIEQEGFLVDMRSLAGFSGSPVFVYRDRPDLTTDVERWVTGFEQRFLGIDFGHLPFYGKVLDGHHVPVNPTMFAEQNSGMAAVIPAWRILQILFEDEDVVAKREQGEAEWVALHDQSSE